MGIFMYKIWLQNSWNVRNTPSFEYSMLLVTATWGPIWHHLSHRVFLSRLSWFCFYFSDTSFIRHSQWLLCHLLFLICKSPQQWPIKHCFASHGRNDCLCSENNTVYISSVSHLWQLQVFIIMISPFWLFALFFILTLFKIYSHASPLKILSSLSTTFLMIPKFFSSVKLINNEDNQVKDKDQRGRGGGIFQ